MTHIHSEIAEKFLTQFNERTNENFQISYDPEQKEYKRISHDLRYKHYFDDYCLLTINWFISLSNDPQIQDWIDQKIYAHRIFNIFEGRKWIYPETEPALFITLFRNLQFDIPTLTKEQASALEKQVNQECEIASSYL